VDVVSGGFAVAGIGIANIFEFRLSLLDIQEYLGASWA
jgi:hypothetical protein